MPLTTVLGDERLAWLLLLLIAFFLPAAFLTTQISQKTFMARIRVFLLLALAYGITAGIYISVKNTVDRPRPFEQINVELRVSHEKAEDLADNGSFPSAHAANAFMLAVLFSAAKKRLSPIFYFIAFMVAFSRIYLGVHFPFDVFAGALIGWSIAKITLSSQWLRKRLAL